VFDAVRCEVHVAHEEVLCYTSAGAGAGLSWSVRIGAQNSVQPTTA